MKNSIRRDLKQSKKKQTATIGVEYGNLTIGSQKRWTIVTQNEIDVVVGELFSCIVEKGAPYFENYSNIETILSICQRDDEIGMLHSPINHVRAINAVGAAKLLNNTDLKEIIKIKEEFLINREDFGLSEFQEFVAMIN